MLIDQVPPVRSMGGGEFPRIVCVVDNINISSSGGDNSNISHNFQDHDGVLTWRP
jgi:hypothetical protein